MPVTTRAVENMFHTIGKKLRYGLNEYRDTVHPHKNYDIIYFVRDYDTKQVRYWHSSETNGDMPDIFEGMIYEALLGFMYHETHNKEIDNDILNLMSQKEIDEFYDWFIKEIRKAKDRRFSKLKEDDDHDHL